MAAKRRNSGRAYSMPAGVGWGIGVALLVTVLGAAVLAWLVSTEKVDVSAIGYVCMVIQTVAAWAGSIISWRLIKHQRLLTALITCGGYYISLLCLALAFGGGLEGLLTTAVMVTLGGGISQIPALIRGGSGAWKVKKRVYR